MDPNNLQFIFLPKDSGHSYGLNRVEFFPAVVCMVINNGQRAMDNGQPTQAFGFMITLIDSRPSMTS